MTRAKMLPDADYDPAREAMSLYMDAVNIFVRIAMILGSGNNRRR